MPVLCERVRDVLAGSETDLLVCDVGAIVNVDAVVIEALARLQLTALRLGGQIRIRHASPALQELLDFVGLADAVPLSPALSLELQRQAEEREQGPGVEERVESDDPAT